MKDRLSQLIKEKQVTPYEIFVKTGVYQSTISLLLAGKTKKLNIRNSELLANYFGVSRNWLMTGKGKKVGNSEQLFDASAVSGQTTALESSIDFAKLQWENARLEKESERLNQIIIEIKEGHIKEIQSMNETIKKLEVENAILRYKEDIWSKVKEDEIMGEIACSVRKTG
jgi:transcriptional regulator with XRE-family HTH domain